jgi:hypothetical protein
MSLKMSLAAIVSRV